MINLHNDHISLEISHMPLVLFNEYFIFDWDKYLVFQSYVLSSEAIWVTRTLWLCKIPQSEVQRIIRSVFFPFNNYRYSSSLLFHFLLKFSKLDDPFPKRNQPRQLKVLCTRKGYVFANVGRVALIFQQT